MIRREATIKLKKSDEIDVFVQVKKEFQTSKRLQIVKVEAGDLKMIRQVTLEYCSSRTRVPDGGATLTFLGIALLGLVGAQRYIRRS